MTRETAIALLESCQNMYALAILLKEQERDENIEKLLDKAQAAILKAEEELKAAE